MLRRLFSFGVRSGFCRLVCSPALSKVCETKSHPSNDGRRASNGKTCFRLDDLVSKQRPRSSPHHHHPSTLRCTLWTFPWRQRSIAGQKFCQAFLLCCIERCASLTEICSSPLHDLLNRQTMVYKKKNKTKNNRKSVRICFLL